MNYLAHLFLSEWTPESLIGNLLGDFTKGAVEHPYSEDIRKGIALHKRVDVYTDSHPIFRSSKRIISIERRRFSGIMIDVFYDHFLAKNWDEYADIPLRDFSHRVYQVLQDNQNILPERLKRMLPGMIAGLTSSKEMCGIDRALKGIAARIKRTNNLGDGVEELVANYQRLESDFCAFFPDLINYTTTYRTQLNN